MEPLRLMPRYKFRHGGGTPTIPLFRLQQLRHRPNHAHHLVLHTTPYMPCNLLVVPSGQSPVRVFLVQYVVKHAGIRGTGLDPPVVIVRYRHPAHLVYESLVRFVHGSRGTYGLERTEHQRGTIALGRGAEAKCRIVGLAGPAVGSIEGYGFVLFLHVGKGTRVVNGRTHINCRGRRCNRSSRSFLQTTSHLILRIQLTTYDMRHHIPLAIPIQSPLRRLRIHATMQLTTILRTNLHPSIHRVHNRSPRFQSAIVGGPISTVRSFVFSMGADGFVGT
mmetsp:Transcript_3594/g.6580  ORF Transcript_3594/g.6580 Transcript_3594/m.6580 type:complete len:277 (+) Transcript_3594:3197-4027(+)